MAQIKKDTSLKNALLQEAVQGKLVPQIASEGNARDLLEEIKTEKAKLIKEGKLKKEKPLPPLYDTDGQLLSEVEVPFEIPENWCWCRLGEIVSILGDGIHGTPVYDMQGEYYFINGNNLSEGIIEIKQDTKKVNEVEFQKYKKELNENTVFVSINGTLGNVAFYNNEKIILGKSACYFNLFRKEMKAYIFSLIKTKYFLDYANEQATGTTIKNVSLASMRNFPIPLPPLAEQKRIVAAIEKFMPLIEEYGKKEATLKELNVNIGTLTKKAILQEAVQGKLVPPACRQAGRLQAKMPTARDLLEEIKVEKAKLIKEGKLKKEKPLPPLYDTDGQLLSEVEVPFEIPDNWCWCRLGEIVFNNGQKTPDKEFSYIDIGSIDNEHQKLNEKENFIQADKAPSRARKIVKKGDIIYSTVRPYLHNMCIIDKDFTKEPIASTGFAVMSCLPQVLNKYLFYYLLSPSFDNYANDTENAKGVAYPAINDERLYKGVVPLPPLAEQKRIVAAIEKLLPPACRLAGEKLGK